ncbi:MAG: hypothetical protein L0Y54_11040 [Sporichthyaceae bacterium]|nr:hypothetical protein [Sporichthyaceae bacterium]
MGVPTTLVALELTLRREHDPVRQGHIAHLAGRLGYRAVWLPVDSATRPDPATLDLLAIEADPARLGLVVRSTADGATDSGPAGLAQWLTGTADALVELGGTVTATAADSDRATLVEAVGGAAGWRARVRTTELDLAAAGFVVHADSRDAAVTELARARAARAAAGLTRAEFPLVVALPVAIGRTMSEAVARALRDPALGAEHDPRVAGLFGRLEDAQEQALALAAAGADVIRATLADEADVVDLLAQLRSVAVGPTPVLHARDRD